MSIVQMPDLCEDKDPDEYDVTHQMVDDIACAVTSAASNAAKERVHAVLRRSSLSVQPNIQRAIRERSTCFSDLFESSQLDLDDIKCEGRTENCPKPAEDRDHREPCERCVHEVAYCNDVPKLIAEYVAARGRDQDDIALIKIGADGYAGASR